MTKLTDKQKAKIVADYLNNQNYSETARMNGVNKSTVKRLIDERKDTKEFQQIATQKKEETTNDILEYMDNIVEDQKEIIDLSLQAMKEKLQNPDLFTNLKDIATVYGVIFDKTLKYREMQLKREEIALKKAETEKYNNTDAFNVNLVNIAELINKPQKIRTEEDIDK